MSEAPLCTCSLIQQQVVRPPAYQIKDIMLHQLPSARRLRLINYSRLRCTGDD